MYNSYFDNDRERKCWKGKSTPEREKDKRKKGKIVLFLIVSPQCCHLQTLTPCRPKQSCSVAFAVLMDENSVLS